TVVNGRSLPMSRIRHFTNGIASIACVLNAVLLACAPQDKTQPATKPAPATAPTTQATRPHSAVMPVPRNDEGWVKRQQGINERAKKDDIDLVFLGDSITQGWEGEGKDVWRKFYGARKAANFGISGDRTQHVLWRLA